jgi:predicted ATP-dependent protease
MRRLEADELSWRCDPTTLPFDTTAELDGEVEPVGQDRAMEALRFGFGMRGEGYNLFVLGPTGSGRSTLTERVLRPFAERPVDLWAWCYVHNFDEAHKPRLLRLPPGRGQALSRDMDALIEELRTAIPSIFESDEYRARRAEIDEELKQEQQGSLQALSDEADLKGVRLMQTPMGFAMAPTLDGEVLSPDQFEELPSAERERIEEALEGLQKKLRDLVRRMPLVKRDAVKRLKALDREMTSFAVEQLIEERRETYEGLPDVLAHLDAVQQHVVQNADAFLPDGDGNPFGLPGVEKDPDSKVARYRINVLVDPADRRSAPVVKELNPSFENLIGRVEHRAQFGALVTDFRLIKSGALHLANGGYLILDARRLLLQPYAWEALKRSLGGGRVVIESPARMLGLAGTISLEPEPMPLEVKVVLVGDRETYYLLQAYDPDFDSLFKVAVDFEDDIDRNDDNIQHYVTLLAAMARERDLLPLDRAATGRILEHAARLTGDSAKLSVGLGKINDLLREADHWAQQAGRERITTEDAQKAIDAAERRMGRIRERIQENILRDTVLIDTDGLAVGQINALSVLQMGGFRFGQPSRITATTRLGEGQVVDVEREVKLGGALHSKGVLILSSFLAARYAKDRPLSLRASLVFEQSYGRVDGDSASMAELCALLSALSGVPIRQSLAITGSVNQHGRSQPIGGVNEKVEGFFDLCAKRGLSGDQGVVIPTSNLKHLMLRREVVEAVRAGTFHVYSFGDVDEAIGLLTGVDAGQPGEDGRYPEGSINHRVDQRLQELGRIRENLSRPPREEEARPAPREDADSDPPAPGDEPEKTEVQP